MNRRSVLKGIGAGLLASSLLPLGAGDASPAVAQGRQARLVVFGADGLRYDLAVRMREWGAPGLSRLNRPMCALSGGGQSVTQPGWIDIWTGLPAVYHGFPMNGTRAWLPAGTHILGKVMDELGQEDCYAVWIVGKGVGLLDGEDPMSPHHPVYRRLVVESRPGVYVGDSERSCLEVFIHAFQALSEAVRHSHFACFIHFPDPDITGHRTVDPAEYGRSALKVDWYISQLLPLLPSDTKVLYCSDHGFNFTARGEVESSHAFAPRGMVATSFPTAPHRNVTRQSVGRWIYALAGGDPDHCESSGRAYAMYGVDIQ